jgi:hypothetical protein
MTMKAFKTNLGMGLALIMSASPLVAHAAPVRVQKPAARESVREQAGRRSRLSFQVPKRGRGLPALTTIFDGREGYDANEKALVRNGQLSGPKVKSAIRNALIYAASGALNPISNPGGANIHHVTCHILAMKQIVEVPLASGGSAIGVRYIGKDPAGAGYQERIFYREGGQLTEIPANQAPSGTKLVAFLEGSSEQASIVPNKSMGDTWHFWDEIANDFGGNNAAIDRGVQRDGAKVFVGDRLASALDALAGMSSWTADARHQLRVTPLMRGLDNNAQPGTEGQFGHRKVLREALVPKEFFTAAEAAEPLQGNVIPAAIQTELYKGTFDPATRTSFITAVEQMVQSQPPASGMLTVYGFGRKSSAWAKPEIQQ